MLKKSFKRLVSSIMQQEESPRPNIIMILLDQLRPDTLKAHPIFDEIFKKGCSFDNTITYAPYTLAALHAVFTGMYGRDNGVDGFTKSDSYDSKSCYSLTQYLNEIDYYTRCYALSPILFPRSGFDQFTFVPEKDERDILGSHKNEIDSCFEQEKKFFLFLHYAEIHHKVVNEVIHEYHDYDNAFFDYPERNRERYSNYVYEAGEYVKAIWDHIMSYEGSSDTLIIFFTDHGTSLGEKPGEKGYGIYVYDYTILTWMCFINPTYFPVGRKIETQVRNIDLMPTLLELLKKQEKKNFKPIKGSSIFPIIKGEITDNRIAFSETGGNKGPHPSPHKADIKCIRHDGWKLIQNGAVNKIELYDLVNDPDEKNNLHSQRRDKVIEMFAELSKYI